MWKLRTEACENTYEVITLVNVKQIHLDNIRTQKKVFFIVTTTQLPVWSRENTVSSTELTSSNHVLRREVHAETSFCSGSTIWTKTDQVLSTTGLLALAANSLYLLQLALLVLVFCLANKVLDARSATALRGRSGRRGLFLWWLDLSRFWSKQERELQLDSFWETLNRPWPCKRQHQWVGEIPRKLEWIDAVRTYTCCDGEQSGWVHPCRIKHKWESTPCPLCTLGSCWVHCNPLINVRTTFCEVKKLDHSGLATTIISSDTLQWFCRWQNQHIFLALGWRHHIRRKDKVTLRLLPELSCAQKLSIVRFLQVLGNANSVLLHCSNTRHSLLQQPLGQVDGSVQSVHGQVSAL